MSVMLTNFVDRADIRMVQSRCGTGFAPEPFERLHVSRHIFGQELQRHKTAKLGVFGFVNDAHAAATELFYDSVMGDGAANQGLGVRHVAHILGATLRQVNAAILRSAKNCDSVG
jgi:hypothetical protein